MNTRRTFIVALLALCLLPSALFAADSKEELQKRFKARYPEIRKLKDAGTIGEADDGYVDFVGAKDSSAADVVDQENADRKALYALIAKETSTSAEQVAKQNAERNLKKAKKGDYLKIDGKWKQKAD